MDYYIYIYINIVIFLLIVAVHLFLRDEMPFCCGTQNEKHKKHSSCDHFFGGIGPIASQESGHVDAAELLRHPEDWTTMLMLKAFLVQILAINK